MFNPDIEMMPQDKLRNLQTDRLKHLASYVFERVPFYKTAFDAKGVAPTDINHLEDISKLPFTKKTDLRDTYPTGLFAVPQSEIIRYHASSGTTGKPTLVAYSRRDIEIFAETVARSMHAAGARPGMVFHNAYGYGLFTGGLGMHHGGEKLGVTVVPVSGGMTERQLMLIQDLKPQVIACTPSYAQTLGEEFKKLGIGPDEISLKYAILGAEPWTDAIRKSAEDGLGIKATNIYGLSEIMGPGVSNEAVEEQDGSYIWEDHFYPEIVDPDTGEPLPEGEDGVLVLTTLTKEALPLIRYWTGDICSITREVGLTGRTHARMSMIRGRNDDMLIIRGVNVFPTQIEAVLNDIDEIEMHYMLIVTREGTMDELELQIELSEPTFNTLNISPESVSTEPKLDTLKTQIRQRVKDTVGITINPNLKAPNTIERSAGGKLRRIQDKRNL